MSFGTTSHRRNRGVLSSLLVVLLAFAGTDGLAVPPVAAAPPEAGTSSGDPSTQTVSSLSIDDPTEEVVLSSLPGDFDVTFTTAAFHVLGRYRAIIWLEGPHHVDLGVRTIPLPITGWEPSGPVTQTEAMTVELGTPPGLYDLCVRAEENWPPGSESWGFSMTRCEPEVIRIDSFVDSVEITQVIQEYQELPDLLAEGPAVPIIQDKMAVMRVYFKEVEEAVSFDVRVQGDSFPGPRTRAMTVEPGCTPEQQRRQLDGCQSADFWLVPREGVDALLELLDGEGNVFEEHELSFGTTATIPLEITPVSVCDEIHLRLHIIFWEWDCADAFSVGRSLHFTRRVFPVPRVDATAPGGTVRRRAPTTGDRDDEREWWSRILRGVNRLRTRAGDEGTQRHWYGAVRDEVPGGILGIGYRPGVDSMTEWLAGAGKTSGERGGETLAHELGHNRTLMHAPCGGPSNIDPDWPDDTNPNALVNEVGFNPLTGRVVDGLDENYRDVMSYCRPKWITAYNYRNLIPRLEVGGALGHAVAATTAGEVWEVAGIVAQDGSVDLAPLFRFDDAVPTAGQTGEWVIEVLDASGATLAEHFFEPQAPMGQDFMGEPAFDELVPFDAAAAHIAVRDPSGQQQALVSLTGVPPDVTIISPSGGEVWDGFQVVEWDATDPDSGDLWFSLEYSSDAGATWEVVDHATQDSGIVVDFAPLAGTEPGDARIRVLASDGVNTGVAVSQGFTVTRQAPGVEVVAPEDGQAFHPETILSLEAVAFDADDGFLVGAAVTWESDRDGLLGDGADLLVTTLSEGAHELTVTVTDSDGNTASDAVSIVIDGTPPELSVSIDGEPLGGGPGEILVLRTTSVSASIETSLLALGLDFTTVATDNFAGVDFGPYDTIVVGLDGGSVTEPDVLALRAAVDAGKRVVGFGATTTAAFVEAVDAHLFEVDTTATSWRQPSTPHFQVVDPAHRLAWRLPETHNFATLPDQTRNPSEYVLDVTDSSVSVAARNGDGVPALFSAFDGALVWMVNTPWGAIWGDPDDTALLDQLLANALEVETLLGAPVTITIDAADEPPGSGLERVDYTFDAGTTWHEIAAEELPFDLEIAEEGEFSLVVRAADRARNRSVHSSRFVVEQTPEIAPVGTQVDGGIYHSLAVASDGSVWAWGLGSSGQLGNGSSGSSTVPVATEVGAAVAVAAGGFHSLVVVPDGGVRAWGAGSLGQLGDGEGTASASPVTVAGLSDAVAVAGGNYHSLAVSSDGTVWAWGYNGSGQLGDGTTSTRSTPVQVSGLSDAVAVAAGGMPGWSGHSLALRADGTVWAWGYNKEGQLGDGTRTHRLTPVPVAGLDEVVAIAADGDASYALRADGTVWAWGDNSYDQLGSPGTQKRSMVPVQAAIDDVVSVMAGGTHALAVRADGTVWAWGNNNTGQLGHGQCGPGTPKTVATPVQVATLTGGSAVAGGYVHSLAVTGEGDVWGWGRNAEGQVGDGTTTPRCAPEPVSGLP